MPLGAAAALLTLVAVQARSGLYRPGPPSGALAELPRVLCAVLLSWCVACTVLVAALPGVTLPRAVLLPLPAVHALLACGARGAVHARRRARNRRRPRPALVAGGGSALRQLTGVLYAHPEYGLRPVGLVSAGPGGDAREAGAAFPVPVLGSAAEITRAVVQNAACDAVLLRGGAPGASGTTREPGGSRPWTAEEAGLAGLAELFTGLGCTVWFVDAPRGHGHPPEPGTGPAAAPHLWGFACRVHHPAPPRCIARAGKRALDTVVAAAALVTAAPLLLACALAVRLADGPGVLFRQERVGAGGRLFVMLKFRTLRPADPHESATRWNVAGDRRMSAVGRLLRRTSLDELPQLWNVLRGDMSLVGPRPERPYFVQRFGQDHPGYAARHRMPAGITGLAQVHGLRGDTSIEDRARFDNHYIDTWSLWQDLLILLRTAGSVFRLGGS
ncbi:sugar transferase [Streptomyces sp. JJ36]|uniref:sugar transferase n=1 Tax=Streptomyces sp. JJ36 TaxID=2736645 RepID=UPI001F1A53E4|nr:sugar transferase [Streptomyces sp. JJ36]